MKIRMACFLTLVLSPVFTLCQTQGEEPVLRTEALDQAQHLVGLVISGGQASPDYWTGFGPGTFMVLVQDRYTVRGDRYESKTLYRIHEPSGDQVVLETTTEDQHKIGALALRSDSRHGMMVSDRDIGRAELTLADGTVYSCDIYERTTKRRPLCHTGEPKYYLTRVTAWHCSGFAHEGGVPKVVLSEEQDWGRGPKPVYTQEIETTMTRSTRIIGNKTWECYEVSIKGQRGDLTVFESTQWRTQAAPGGILESVERRRSGKTDNWWGGHYWIEDLETNCVDERHCLPKLTPS